MNKSSFSLDSVMVIGSLLVSIKVKKYSNWLLLPNLTALVLTWEISGKQLIKIFAIPDNLLHITRRFSSNNL